MGQWPFGTFFWREVVDIFSYLSLYNCYFVLKAESWFVLSSSPCRSWPVIKKMQNLLLLCARANPLYSLEVMLCICKTMLLVGSNWTTKVLGYNNLYCKIPPCPKISVHYRNDTILDMNNYNNFSLTKWQLYPWLSYLSYQLLNICALNKGSFENFSYSYMKVHTSWDKY